MTRSAAVWVVSRLAIVGTTSWVLVACSSNHRAEPTYYGTVDSGPVLCTVATAPVPSCELLVEPLPSDAGSDADAGESDAASDDGGSIGDAGAPDATIFGTRDCPITTTSAIACGDTSDVVLSVAAAPNGDAYATLVTPVTSASSTHASQLVTLKSDGTGTVDLEPVPKSSTLGARTLTNGDGSPGIAAERDDGDRRYWTRNGGAWSGEAIPGSTSSGFALAGAASAKNGEVYALLSNGTDSVTLSTRAAAGGWTAGAAISIPGAASSTLALDVEGTPYVLAYGSGPSASSASFWLSTASGTPVSYAAPSQLTGNPIFAVAGARGAAKDPLAFVYQFGDSTVDVYDVEDPNAQRSLGGLSSTTCSPFTLGITCDDCQAGAECHTYYDKIYGFSTAVTDDGTAWVAYVAASVDELDHVELDSDPILPLGCVCTSTARSTSEQAAAIVVEPLGPKGASTGVSMRMPIPTDDGSHAIALAANGAALHVLVSTTAGVTHTAIDTSRIPH